MSDEDMKTEAEALAAIVCPPVLVEISPLERTYLVPPGWVPQTIQRDDYRAEIFEAGDQASFVAMVNEVRKPESRLFYNPASQNMSVVVDYMDTDDRMPGRQRHGVRLTMQEGRTWKAWQEIDRKPLRKERLLELLLEHGHAVVSPPAAEMYELVRDLKATKKVVFKDIRDVSSGSFEVQWSDETKAVAGTFKVPRQVVVRCAPWKNADHVDVTFEFRYDLGEQGLTLTLVALPMRMDEIKEDAFAALAQSTAAALGMHAYFNAQLH